MFIRVGRPTMGVLGLTLIVIGPALSLPVNSLQIVQGAVTIHPGSGYTSFELTVASNADVAIEKVQLVIGCQQQQEGQDTAGEGPEELWYYFDPMLEVGEERAITFQSERVCLQPTLRVKSVRPALRLHINGKPVEVTPRPFLWKGKVFGPVGQIARLAGVEVRWYDRWQTAALITQKHAVVLQMGCKHAVVDGRLRELSAGLRMVRGNLIGPVAPIMKWVGAEVSYSQKDNVSAIRHPAGSG